MEVNVKLVFDILNHNEFISSGVIEQIISEVGEDLTRLSIIPLFAKFGRLLPFTRKGNGVKHIVVNVNEILVEEYHIDHAISVDVRKVNKRNVFSIVHHLSRPSLLSKYRIRLLQAVHLLVVE